MRACRSWAADWRRFRNDDRLHRRVAKGDCRAVGPQQAGIERRRDFPLDRSANDPGESQRLDPHPDRGGGFEGFPGVALPGALPGPALRR